MKVITKNLAYEEGTLQILKKNCKNKFYKDSNFDKRFGTPIIEFELRVPTCYKHEKQLEKFARANRKKFYYYNSILTDKNFSRNTTKLLPGEMYWVKIFPIHTTVTSDECLNFLRDQKMKFAGCQGLSLVWSLYRDFLPVDAFTISFDEKESLWNDGNQLRMPSIHHYSFGYWGFGLGLFDSGCTNSQYLLCFSTEK